jgi:hypothetical protein
MATASPDGTVVINPNVVGNRVIRKMIRDGVDELLNMCIKNHYSFVYETLWQNADYYYESVLLPTKESFSHVLTYVFQNDNVEDVVTGLTQRSGATGRYVPETFAREKWEEGMQRTLIAGDVKYTGGPLLQSIIRPDSGSGGAYLVQTRNDGSYEIVFQTIYR